jgi:hypothetical protein
MCNRIISNAGVGCSVFKNAAIFFIVILINVGCTTSNAQSANQDGSRLVGTWVEVYPENGNPNPDESNLVKDGETCVFNSGGTGSTKDKVFRYAAIAGKIMIRGSGSNYGYISKNYEFAISTDGKNLFLGDMWLRKSTGK